jgi:5-methylcytosine-specific restriction enzyme B
MTNNKIENYLNDDASAFFHEIKDEENRDWVWRFLKIIKRRFPKADHYVTGGKDSTYIDIRVGKKDSSITDGAPVFYFQKKKKDGIPYCFLHDKIRYAADIDELANFENQRSDAQIEAWIDKYLSAITSEKNADLEGKGLNPINFLRENRNSKNDTENEKNDFTPSSSEPITPLNQIMYGPPGTGKTYATIDESLKVLDSEFFKKNQNDRATLKERFDAFVTAGQIRFTTFHQSFSYEDFIEGLRAIPNDNQLEYRVEPGIFKLLCDKARTQTSEETSGVKPSPNIWKISINGTGSNKTKTYCLDNGEARIGWGETGDLFNNGKATEYYKSLGSSNQGTLQYFSEGIEIGDIVLCIQSNKTVDAIGVVTSDYSFEEKPPAGVSGDYNHVRKVNWLYRDLNLSILPLNDNKVFVQKTVYSIDRFTWGDLLSYLEQSKIAPTKNSKSTENLKPYVLVIDEINRGNISRIFGELISLIEPSKRAGAKEQLSVTLPYSKNPFTVPSNVYLIGTMNTADRSLAGLDIALRRRFTFQEMAPKPKLLNDVIVENVGVKVNIGAMLAKMNERIEALLDRDHCLGHAYFFPLKEKTNEPEKFEALKSIFRNQILPLLQEYFFEDWERIGWVLNDHTKDAEHKFIELNSVGLTALFGETVANTLTRVEKRWHINEAAFEKIESYLGITS